MNKLFDLKLVRKINLLFCFVYLLPIVFLIIYSFLKKDDFNAKVLEIKCYKKYKYQITSIILDNNKSIEYKFMFNYFDQNKFLNLSKGDEISYSLVKESLGEIENKKNNHKLSILYFIVTDYYGYFILLNVLMGLYNIISYLNFKSLSIIHKIKKNEQNKVNKFNYWTKKNPIPALVAIGLLIYLLYSFNLWLRSKQEYLEVFSLYKYLILYVPFLIILPYIILNFKSYQKFKQNNLLN